VAELFDPVRGNSEPDRCWTFTNISEATPDILSPLCWDVWDEAAQETMLGSMAALGALAKSEVVIPRDPNGRTTSSIYGRQAFNVDALRAVMARVPGIDVDELERDLLGSVRPDAPAVPGPRWRRIPIMAAKGPYTMLRAAARVQQNYRDTKSWWRAEVLDVYRCVMPPRRSAIDDLIVARNRFARSFYLHSFVRYQLMAVQGAVIRYAEKIGQPELGTAALAGQGGVIETQLADDAWRLARGELTADAFIVEHGYRGPNEGNVFTKSWREQPDRVRGLAKAQANRSGLERPSRRAELAGVAAREAAARLIAATSRADRLAVRLMLARARNVIPRLEVGKSAYVMPLDGARAAARRLGAEQLEAGRSDEIDDAFFLTIPELQQVVSGGLPGARDLIAYRRNARREYAAMTLPVHFTGMPEPIDGVCDVDSATGPVELAGAASGGGVVEGRARVILDPNEDVELDEGDILVCRFTDPSWAPLFTLAEALVIDLGSGASHGAVVAREMGIAYVIGTQTGTTAISDGDRIRVDGTRNTVRILR
jgi:pyruvate,water dikinase